MSRHLPAWRSLRVRLPLLLSTLIAVVLIAVFWVINREIEQTLIRTGTERAQTAADQISSMMSQNAGRGINEVRRVASLDAVRQLLANPSGDGSAARNALTPLAVAAQPPVELWTADERSLLEVGPTRGMASSLDATVPLRPGLTAFHVAHNIVFYALVAEVTDGGTAGAQRIAGYIVVKRTLATAQTTETLNRLLGNGAAVALGHPTDGVWTNFAAAVPAPPIDATRNGVVAYRTASGEARLGAVRVVSGTPWAAWVEFPRDRILAPARALRGRMMMIGLAIVALSALVTGIVTARLTRPLYELTSATTAMAAGEYAGRVQSARRDEVGLLADAFNVMTARVRAAHEDLERRVSERTASLSEATAALRDRVADLNHTRAELDRFFSLSLDLLCIAGTDGRFRRVNRAWTETLGWTAEELTTQPYVNFVHPEDRGATAVVADGLAAGGTTVQFQNRFRTKDGAYRWLSWNSVTSGEQSDVIYAVARDVTDERQAALAREHHVIELKAINDELESFSYSVSHDLRAPVRHVVGFASLLEKSAGARLLDEDRRYLNTIINSANRMGRLIDDLLSFSRMGRTALDQRSVSLDRIVQEAIDEVRPEGRQDIVWCVHALPDVDGDPAMLRLVFVNLLSNAVKYSARQPQPRIEVNVDGAGSADTVVYVRDNGVGFDMAYADKLFGVFQRLHSSDEFDGTGIGLANVRRIVHRHGGEVWADSAVDQGATFYVSLPRKKGRTQ